QPVREVIVLRAHRADEDEAAALGHPHELARRLRRLGAAVAQDGAEANNRIEAGVGKGKARSRQAKKTAWPLPARLEGLLRERDLDGGDIARNDLCAKASQLNAEPPGAGAGIEDTLSSSDMPL